MLECRQIKLAVRLSLIGVDAILKSLGLDCDTGVLVVKLLLHSLPDGIIGIADHANRHNGAATALCVAIYRISNDSYNHECQCDQHGDQIPFGFCFI